MSATVQDELPAGLTPELVERVLALPGPAQDRLSELLADARRNATRDEIARRLAAVDSGRMPTYTPDDVMEYVRKQLEEDRRS